MPKTHAQRESDRSWKLRYNIKTYLTSTKKKKITATQNHILYSSLKDKAFDRKKILKKGRNQFSNLGIKSKNQRELKERRLYDWGYWSGVCVCVMVGSRASSHGLCLLGRVCHLIIRYIHNLICHKLKNKKRKIKDWHDKIKIVAGHCIIQAVLPRHLIGLEYPAKKYTRRP